MTKAVILRKLVIVAFFGMANLAQPALGRGVSPYLPLNTSPNIERQFERVLILAGRPVVRRPIPAALVLDALPDACKRDHSLCEQVRAYLERYKKRWSVTQLQAEAAAVAGDSDRALPNAHGQTTQSVWLGTASAFYQLGGYLSITAGAIAYQGRITPTGSMLSAGFDFAQLDVGFRDHWFSPLSTSSMLIGTEAPTMPSVTLSNYRPLTPLGITYELFAASMSHQDGIEIFNGTTSGRPHLVGIQGGIQPVRGYALAVNKLMQYGGGARGGASLSDLRKAIFNNSYQGSAPDGTFGGLEFGNQVASVSSTMQFPGAVPFSVNFEYAGEDALYRYDGNYRLGDSAVSVGLDFPKLWQRYDLKYEVTEWQNAWYVHHLYPRGLTNDGFVLGHWFGDQRKFGDQVGGHSHVVQMGMHTDSGAYWQATYRTLAFVSSAGFQSVPEVPYRHLQELGLRYSTSWHGHETGAELQIGRDAFGEKYGRLSASIDLAGGEHEIAPMALDAEDDVGEVNFFLDVGINRSHVYQQITQLIPDSYTPLRNDYHVGFGVRRPINERNDLGVRVEADRVDGRGLLSIRAIDYRFKLTPKLALAAFGGVGRYHYGAPAFGWYGGIGAQILNVVPKWDVGFDWRYYDKLSRDRILKDDPAGTINRPRLHFDVKSVAFYVSRNF